MRYLHTRIRVRDLDRSIRFYEVLGLVFQRRSTSPRGNALAFVQDPATGADIELCRMPREEDFSFPEDIFHVAFQVDDLDSELKRLEAAGVKITERPSNPGPGSLAFIEDPDGYEIELLERRT